MNYKLYDHVGVPHVLLKDILTKFYGEKAAGTATDVRKAIVKNSGVDVCKILVKVGRSMQKMYVVKGTDVGTVELFLAERRGLTSEQTFPIVAAEPARFYVLQKYPEKCPQIVKMGVTTRTVEKRSKEYHVYNPCILLDKEVVISHEKTLIRMIAGANEQLGEEEFWVDDIPALMDRANKIFEFYG